ncbi:MAG: sensor histidine kinase N-terminal domain-containing protein, partial [Burkholderiales bacterium]|nr:sensor histidine kinase N-terminal domain-containing protein [Burkholderiales bacterium]
MRSFDHAVRQTDEPLPDHPGQTYDFAPPDESEPRSPSRSLFGEILDWMLAPLLLLWPLSLAVTYLIAQSIANGPFDHTLQTNAYVLAQQVHRDGARASLALPPAALDFLRADS